MNEGMILRKYHNVQLDSPYRDVLGDPLNVKRLQGETELCLYGVEGAIFQMFVNSDKTYLRSPHIIGKAEDVEEGERELKDLGLELKLKEENGN